MREGSRLETGSCCSVLLSQICSLWLWQKIFFTSLRLPSTWIFKTLAMRPASSWCTATWYDSQKPVTSRGAQNHWRSFGSCCWADRRWNRAEAAQSVDVILVAPLWEKKKEKAATWLCLHVISQKKKKKEKPAYSHTGCRWSTDQWKWPPPFPSLTTHWLPGGGGGGQCKICLCGLGMKW